ncbi:MAG: efflux transporter, RND family, MFP subunit [uncultured bacterium]|nr:MAG: efflux transporter, RND family, MFP subunit [uncultured bacterium]
MLPAIYSWIRGSRKRILLLALFLLIVLGFIAFWFLSRVEVVAYEIRKEDAIKGVTVSGTVESSQDVQLATEVTGKIQQINFQEGDFVNQGQILATLNRDEVAGNLTAAQGQLQTAQAQAQNLINEPRVQQVAIAQAQVAEVQGNIGVLQQELQRARVQLQEAVTEEQRLQRLYQLGAVSLRELETALFARAQLEEQIGAIENQIEAAQARLIQARQNLNLVQEGATQEQIRAARGQVQAARGGVQSTLGRVENYIVRAPVTGYIVEKIRDIGEVASPTNPIARLVTPEALYLSTQVEENELGSIKAGQTVYVIFDAYPDRTFTGKVIQVSKNVDPITGTFEAKVSVPAQKGLPVLVGMTGDATIIIQRVENAIIIPEEFIYTENQRKYVLRKKGNEAIKTYITGVTFDNNRFMVTKGLCKGDVIVTGTEDKKVEPGNRIKVVEDYRD